MKHTIQEELRSVIVFVGVIWGVFLVDWMLPIDLNRFGVTPRTLTGLVGIPATPFLHANLQHLAGNTLPLFFLLILLAGSPARSWAVVAAVTLLGGALLWLLGRPATHVGASLLIFGLIVYLIVSGFLEKRVVSLLISLAVGLLYGGTLLSGILPRFGSTESWEGHLFGAIAGGVVAYALARERGRPPEQA